MTAIYDTQIPGDLCRQYHIFEAGQPLDGWLTRREALSLVGNVIYRHADAADLFARWLASLGETVTSACATAASVECSRAIKIAADIEFARQMRDPSIARPI